MSSHAHRAVALVTAASLLTGCVSTRAGRIGADDGTDACRAQLVALDSTGDFFAEDILKGAAAGALTGALIGGLATGRWQGALIGAGAGLAAGAATGYLYALQQRNADQAALNASIAGDLSRENAQLDKTQLAFNQLMDCRFMSAQQIRLAYSSGRLPRVVADAQMADLRARTQRDIALAQTISERIGTRGAEFDTAIEAVAPGTKNSVAASKARISTVSTRTAAAVPLRLRPDPASPIIATVPARETVQVRPSSGGFAQVSAAGGQVGYADTASFRGTPAARLGSVQDPASMGGSGGDVRTLAASNIARRENFTESVTTAQRASSSGFELASL
jgi:hypothetical protein